MTQVNDFVLQIATANGSGSQSANNVLVRALFRMGVPVAGKNLFPSNIQGLPTWFTIRAHPKGYVSRRPTQDIVVTLNPSTALDDQKQLKPGGLFLHSSDCKLDPAQLRADAMAVTLPLRELTQNLSPSIRTRKLLANMVYVGILAEILGLDQAILGQTISDQFEGKGDLLKANHDAVQAGRQWAKDQNLAGKTEARARSINGGARDKVLIDGNTAGAMGLICGGCTFAAWYPITPSSSVMENFISYMYRWRKDGQGKLKGAVVQAEDELAAISMVIGAGWAGARAVTATSGPGLSLMAEAAGLAYFAEVPAVIWNVQRVGPSTGLPTRTMQGDLTFAAYLSHGDTKHVLLLPSKPAECFEFGQTALDLAEHLQTLVIVMSDLDLGMNLHEAEAWTVPTRRFNRGKVLDQEALNRVSSFARYADLDGDGIGARTLPGTPHEMAAYFARGTGHNDQAQYSEDPDVFKRNMDRLSRKWETARTLVPKPIADLTPGANIGIIAFGSSDAAVPELRDLMAQKGLKTSYLRIRAFPFGGEVGEFLANHSRVYVVEQNRDGQMRSLLANEYPRHAGRLLSSLSYDGAPLAAVEAARNILQQESSL